MSIFDDIFNDNNFNDDSFDDDDNNDANKDKKDEDKEMNFNELNNYIDNLNKPTKDSSFDETDRANIQMFWTQNNEINKRYCVTEDGKLSHFDNDALDDIFDDLNYTNPKLAEALRQYILSNRKHFYNEGYKQAIHDFSAKIIEDDLIAKSNKSKT